MLWRELGEDEFNLKSTSTKEKRWRHFVLRAGQRLDELSLLPRLLLPASDCLHLLQGLGPSTGLHPSPLPSHESLYPRRKRRLTLPGPEASKNKP